MSRQTSRSTKHTGRERSTDSKPGESASTRGANGPSWLVTMGMAILAIVLTFASTSPIYSISKLTINPRGILAALVESDYVALNRRPENAMPGKPTFAAIVRQYSSAAQKRESVRNYRAVKQARDAYAAAVDENRPPSQADLGTAAAAAQVDRYNFVPRLLLTAILDGMREPQASPADRLAAMEDVFEAVPIQTACTTYDDEYRDQLLKAFAASDLRPDIAASMASQWYSNVWDYRSIWFSILPPLADQLMTLRNELAAAGNAEGAAQCERWLTRFCIGLIDTSNDTAVQCLAADVLAHHLKRKPDVAKPMRRLVDAHTSTARYHGADWAAQIKSNGDSPQASLAPGEYESAFERLVLYTIFIGLAMSAALAFVFGIASALTPTDKSTTHLHSSRRPWHPLARLVLIVIAIPTLLAILNANVIGPNQSFYSQSLAVAVMQAVVFLGISVIMIHAACAAWPDRNIAAQVRRIWPAILMCVACSLFLAMPAASAARLLRSVNYAFPQNLWSAAAMVLFTMFAVLVARVPARSLARSAAGAWLCFALFACITMRLHVNADHAYQRAIVAAHRDPMAARVGEDWKQEYLEPVKKAFTPPIP